MGNKDIELQEDPPTDGEKRVSIQEEQAPPRPPKRELFVEEQKSQPEGKKKFLGSFPRPEVIYKPESNKTFMTCLKNLFIIFNLFIWIFGAVLTGIGVWIKVDENFWEIQSGLDMKQFAVGGYVLIAAGVFIMIVGFLGCYGAFTESVCLLIMYSVVVILIILLELAVAGLVWTASNNKDLKDKVKAQAKKALQEMAQDDNQRYFLDLMQKTLNCCGIDGPDEFDEYGSIPHSCRNPETGYPFKQGCLETVIQYLKGKAAILGGVAIGIFILQLAAIVVTIILLVGLKQSLSNSII